MAPIKVFLSTSLTLVLFLLINHINAQDLQSPCPRLFVYEPRTEPNKWYGSITLLSETTLNGIWLRVMFDRPSIQLGNWFGNVRIRGENEYLINNREFNLTAYVPQFIRFYIQYNPNEPAPQLVSFRLNARTLCPEGAATEVPPPTTKLHTSGPLGVASVTPNPATTTELIAYEETPEDKDLNAVCGTVVLPQPTSPTEYRETTQKGEFPWHAVIYQSQLLDVYYLCGGSLISRYHVLTVAHCVMEKGSQVPLNPERLTVYLGKYYLKSYSSKGTQTKEVENIIPHPQYNVQTSDNDIAVVKFIIPADFTDYVRPLCLWTESADLNTVLNKQGGVVGWGYDEGNRGKYTDQLMQAKMEVVAKETCAASFSHFYSRYTADNAYCAGFVKGTSVCHGDAGGGMVFPKPNSSPDNPVWQLRGLISVRASFHNLLSCDETRAILTDVAKYINWIRVSMKA